MPFESEAQKSEISAFLSGFVNAMGTLEIKKTTEAFFVSSSLKT